MREKEEENSVEKGTVRRRAQGRNGAVVGVGSLLAFPQGLVWSWEGAVAYSLLGGDRCSLVLPAELSVRAPCAVQFILCPITVPGRSWKERAPPGT